MDIIAAAFCGAFVVLAGAIIYMAFFIKVLVDYQDTCSHYSPVWTYTIIQAFLPGLVVGCLGKEGYLAFAISMQVYGGLLFYHQDNYYFIVCDAIKDTPLYPWAQFLYWMNFISLLGASVYICLAQATPPTQQQGGENQPDIPV